MHIQLATPAAKGSRVGNRIGAERWAAMLRELGHRVSLDTPARDPALLIALHARRSARAVRSFRAAHPGRPVVVVLTGTDLYGDLPRGHQQTLATVEHADRLVVLQPAALRSLPPALAANTRVILQSVAAPTTPIAPRSRTFDICVAGHLRHVKDPLRAAMAARLLPDHSRIAVLHAGGVLERRYGARVVREAANNARYTWLGELSHRATQRLIQRSRALVISSRAEGGAHVVGEALVAGTAVLASHIDGNVGMLGDNYPGLYPVGDTRALMALMLRMENDARFRKRLERWCKRLATAYHPDHERRALRALLAELA